MTSNQGAQTATEIPNIYKKLASLLSTTKFRSSADVIDAFEAKFPGDWKHLQKRFGDRTETPGEGSRRHFYAASTYLADRLATMARMGFVELKHTLDFDRTRWKHNKRMGTWKLKDGAPPLPEDVGPTHRFTVELPTAEHEKLVLIADRRDMPVTMVAAELLTAAIRIGA